MPKQDKDFVEIMEKEIAEKEEELSDFDMQLGSYIAGMKRALSKYKETHNDQ